MIYTISTIAAVAIVLFILSFFMNDKVKELESQVDQVHMTMMQNHYQMQKKMKVLEEELLTEDLSDEIIRQPMKENPPSKQLPLVDTVLTMYKKGYKTHYIAKQTNLSEHDVTSMIEKRERVNV